MFKTVPAADWSWRPRELDVSMDTVPSKICTVLASAPCRVGRSTAAANSFDTQTADRAVTCCWPGIGNALAMPAAESRPKLNHVRAETPILTAGMAGQSSGQSDSLGGPTKIISQLVTRAYVQL